MSLDKHSRQLLVIIAEASLEKQLVHEVMRLGAHGYTVADVRGAGAGGTREGAWEADRTIRMEVICEDKVADEIAAHVMKVYAPYYGLTIFFTQVGVLRPQKF